MGFTMVTADLFEAKEQNCIVATGLLTGHVSVGHMVCVIRPEKDYLAIIARIDQKQADKTVSLKEAGSGSTALWLMPQGEFKIGKYDIVADIPNTRVRDNKKPMISAQLCGYLAGLSVFKDDPAYMDNVIYSIVHSFYLVPMKEEGEDAVYPGIPAKTGVEGNMLPVFTHQAELNKWQGYAEGEEVKVATLSFPELVEVIKLGGFAGIAINAFGDFGFEVNSVLIEEITNLDAYKKEFR